MTTIHLDNIKRAYFIGIGGIGVSALAKLFLYQGKRVEGSDSSSSEITNDLTAKGVKIYIGQKAENLSADFDLVIFSDAVPEDNPERIKAKELKIIELSYFEVLGEISKQKRTIAITGAHGKTTTTAMTGLTLKNAGFDPTIIVGSKIKQLENSNFSPGKSDYFVVEACEYRAHMLKIEPKVIILTNIDEEHLDYYKDLAHIVDTFQKFVDKLSGDNILVYNNDDQNIEKLILPDCQKISYGIFNNADIVAKDIATLNGKVTFTVKYKSNELGNFSLQVPGVHNIYNALAVIACGLKLDIPLEKIKESLENYQGAWRRFDHIGNLKINGGEAKVISDYGHHPTEVKATIKAAKEFYPKERLFVVFQPHLHSRTKKLFTDFTESFDLADVLVLSEIYFVRGREEEEDQNVSSNDLAKEIRKRPEIINKKTEVIYSENLDTTYDLILKNAKADDVILVMGAGDIYDVAKRLVE